MSATATRPAGAARPATAPPRRRRRGSLAYTGRDRLVMTLMVGLPLLVISVFILLPTLASLGLSLFQWSGIGPLHLQACPKGVSPLLSNGCFVGGDNYHQAATVYPPFWPAVRHNVVWLLVFLLVASPLGMLFAVLIDHGARGSRIYQSVLFLPVMLSLALIGIIWEFMYSSNNGLINTAIGRNGTNAIDWLGDPHLNLWAVLLEGCWRQAGYVMVLYLAGLKAVDRGLLEAAKVDGASAWNTFWRVVFPVMRPINIVVLVVTVIESLRAFDLVYITNKGTNGLELLSVLVTTNINGETQRIGFGSALGVVLLVVSLVPITMFLRQAFRREDPA